jgi:uncharacterized protein (DUF433 family)
MLICEVIRGLGMSTTTNESPTVIRTSRGLSIAGTRITLYALLDYIHADWPPKLIKDWFNLTDQQMDDVFAYLAEHRDDVEHEYQQVVQQAEANRQYWEVRNRERTPHRSSTPVSSEQAALRAKLQDWKARLEQR